MIGERNLAPGRGPNVWVREAGEGRISRKRLIDGLGGAAMAAAGAALVAAGGSRLIHAVAGRGKAVVQGRPDIERDEVAFESNQSFPASDSPSWTPVDGASPRDTL